MSVLAYSSGTDHVTTPPISQRVLEKEGSVSISIPERQLANKSLQITPLNSKSYVAWSIEDRSNVYAALQKTVDVWKKSGFADQYLVYGKQQSSDMSFNWEVVPYYKPSTFIGRIWQQFFVLWKITFGGTTLSESQRQKEVDEYKAVFKEFMPSVQDGAQKIMDVVQGNDAFCKAEVINKQLVLEGRSINVLYNYAPIGFGGERLHFLIVPKEHKTKFSELSEEEYLEATDVSQKLMSHFSVTREIEDVYIFHKTGVDAGQTVPHWHMHMILTSNKTQDIFGKLTVLKNMLIGSSPMKGEELSRKVSSLKDELKFLQTKSQ